MHSPMTAIFFVFVMVARLRESFALLRERTLTTTSNPVNAPAGYPLVTSMRSTQSLLGRLA